jgi:ribonuclease HII
VQLTPDVVHTNVPEMPAFIYERYKDVKVAVDIMYVNKIPYFVSISRDIHFCTSEMLHDLKNQTILKAVGHVVNIYKTRDFRVTHILADGQLDSLSNEIAAMGIIAKITARDEHVPEIECHIRTLKEQVRSIYNTLPFKSVTKRMLAELIYNCTFSLNCIPHSSGISATISPRTIITGKHMKGIQCG